jgi:hypothetical protein
MVRQYIFVALTLVAASPVMAQFDASGQLRIRSELRNGQGSPSIRDTSAAFFISQRTRVNLGFTAHRIRLFTAIQDVRVWGQDASTLNRTTNDGNDGLMVHEAWTEINLLDTGRSVFGRAGRSKPNLTLKAGRQELVYDDVRLLGNLDWLQQARRHDAVLLKLEQNGWTAHAGAGFNQNAERKSNTIYNGVPTGYVAGTNGINTLYKSMQFLYIGRKQKWGSASFLLFKDDFSRFHYAKADSLKRTPIYDRSAWSRFTSGFYVNATFKKFAFTGSAYYQGGHYREGTSLSEYLLSLSTQYVLTPKISFGPGIDVTSGNNGSDPAKKYKRFDPLYGTPHKFWGYMDYFYVADGFGSNGLVDVYLRARHKPQDNITLSLDVHQFSLPNAVVGESGDVMKKLLGTEIDATIIYAITKELMLEGGASYMAATPTMSSLHVKNITKASQNASWAYVMLTVKPGLIARKP